MRAHLFSIFFFALFAGAFATACGSSHGIGEDSGLEPDSGVDVGILVDAGPRPDVRPDARPDARSPIQLTQLDLLFVIDNSGSMREEQTALARQIPRLMERLTSSAVQDLHVGVVTPDMGTGGNTISTCNEPNFGDDGILRTEDGCGVRSPRYLSFGAGGDVEVLVRQVACLANVGTSGCGFEQPLEALLKAVTPNLSETVFVQNTHGHAGGENEDFLRPNSLLVVIMLTDEDDCSAANPDVFNRFSTLYPGEDLNLRCFQYGAPEFGAVHPIQRYVQGLLAVHPARQLMFGAIAGIPEDLAGREYGETLRDPRMIEMPAAGSPGLVPSCTRPGAGLAYPPRRIVQVAQGLEAQGVQTVVESICQDDFSAAIDVIGDRIEHVLR